MEAQTMMENVPVQPEDRRRIPRHEVDEDASMLLVQYGSRYPCRVLDLSMGGCRMKTHEPFLVGSSVRVEVTFRVHGIVFRFPGTTQWTDGQNLVGIQFQSLSPRRQDELIEVLHEVASDNAAKEAKRAEEERAAAELEAQRIEAERLYWEEDARRREEEERLASEPPAPPAESSDTVVKTPAAAQVAAAKAAAGDAKSGKKVHCFRERRAFRRHAVNTSAVIRLVKIASEQRGRMVDISQGGCRILTYDTFPVGIYTRVEVDFQLDGMNFRLGGVVQSFHNGNNVGVRFLDISERKQQLLNHLISELVEIQEPVAKDGEDAHVWLQDQPGIQFEPPPPEAPDKPDEFRPRQRIEFL